jgi:hypothetical protein
VSRKGVIQVKGVLSMEVAAYLQNKKRKELAELESQHGVDILLESDPSIPPGAGKLEFVRADEGPSSRPEPR